MVLVDTSVWIDFLREGNELLKDFLENGQVYIHPFVIGELSCGNIQKRIQFLSLLNELPTVSVSSNEEVIQFIESNSLFGKGVGYIDLHILCSSIKSNIPIWSKDKRLTKISKSFYASV